MASRPPPPPRGGRTHFGQRRVEPVPLPLPTEVEPAEHSPNEASAGAVPVNETTWSDGEALHVTHDRDDGNGSGRDPSAQGP